MKKAERMGICEEVAYASFFKSHAKTLRNYLYFKYGNQEQANDMAQEAFIKLWENCANVPIEKAKSFLYTVANNSTLNQLQHQKVVLTYAKNHAPPSTTNVSPEFLAEKEQFKTKLEKAIANLTEGQRTAFLLHRIEGKKYAEIATMLGITVKAVEKRIHGAMVSLRQEIEQLR